MTKELIQDTVVGSPSKGARSEEEGSEAVRVSITITRKDQENIAMLKEAMHARTNNQTVSTGLALSAAIVKLMQEGGELLVRKDDKVERLIFPGIG